MRTVVDQRRGCGWRKGGAMYLVSGQLSEPCPRLPVEMTVCSCCGQGIRPARGFTWVDGGKLIPPRVHGSIEHSAVCPLAPANWDDVNATEDELVSRLGDRTGLIWIGEAHYKTPLAFMREAELMGVSRRITAVPRDFVVGQTWVLLGHRKAISEVAPQQKAAGSEIEYIHKPGIITAFRPTAIEYVVKGDETDEDLEALEARGIEPVKVIRAEQQAMEAV